MASLLKSALYYAAELGWAVFPLVPGDKVPLTAHGLKDATKSAEQITAWWTQHPRANIGLATGEVSGVDVIDVDGPQGEAALAAFGPLPPTPVSTTGKGRHLLFQASGLRNSAGKLGPQIDTRGDGGYIVAPPSVHPSGAVYKWVDGADPTRVALAVLPRAIAERLAQPLLSRGPLQLLPGEPVATAAEIPLQESIGEGGRNQTLSIYAGRMLAKGISELETLELVRGLNVSKCAPPLPPDEVERIVMSIAAAERRQRTAKAREVLQPSSGGSSLLVGIDRGIFDLLADRNTQPIDALPTMLPMWNDACRGFGGSRGLPRGWHITIGGTSGSGKSLAALNLVSSALHHGAKVAYISLEMSIDQLLARLLAIFNIRPVRELEPGDLYRRQTYDACVSALLDKCESGAGLFIAERPSSELEAVRTQMLAAADYGCRLIVIDYLQLVSVPDAEGLPEQTRRASQSVQRVAFARDVTTVALSQFNRATSYAKESPTMHGLTGSSAIENDSDQVLLLDHSQQERHGTLMETRLLLTKNRHGPQAAIPVRWDYTTLNLEQRAPTLDEEADRHAIPTKRRFS